MSPKLAYSERYDWRLGVETAAKRPRAYQPRAGGPPLLFATDVRMSILVTLALANRPLRCADLWRHIGRRNFGCVRDLARRGLIACWQVGRATLVALEPNHPAVGSMRALLLRVARRYGFPPPLEQCSMIGPVAVPVRRAKIDPRLTFGDKNRTLPLLIVAIRGRANSEQVARCIPRSDPKTVRHILLMFKAEVDPVF